MNTGWPTECDSCGSSNKAKSDSMNDCLVFLTDLYISFRLLTNSSNYDELD